MMSAFLIKHWLSVCCCGNNKNHNNNSNMSRGYKYRVMILYLSLLTTLILTSVTADAAATVTNSSTSTNVILDDVIYSTTFVPDIDSTTITSTTNIPITTTTTTINTTTTTTTTTTITNDWIDQIWNSIVSAINPELYPSISSTPTNNTFLITSLLVSGPQQYLLEVCLIISSLSLVASLIVYCIVPEFRTVPGKCLMGLIVSELITNLLVIAAIHTTRHTKTCLFVSIALHYFFLTIICWTNVIAFDILRKIKYPYRKLHNFVRNIFSAYFFPAILVGISLAFEFYPQTSSSRLKPHYGEYVCGIGAPLAKVVFITMPINISLLINVTIFLYAIYKLKQLVVECSHSNISIPLKKRCAWYTKLSLLLGLSSLFGYFGIQLSCCKLFKVIAILINSLHGFYIFIAFACKRSTFKLLAKHMLNWNISSNSSRRNTITNSGRFSSVGFNISKCKDYTSKRSIRFSLESCDNQTSSPLPPTPPPPPPPPPLPSQKQQQQSGGILLLKVVNIIDDDNIDNSQCIVSLDKNNPSPHHHNLGTTTTTTTATTSNVSNTCTTDVEVLSINNDCSSNIKCFTQKIVPDLH